MASIAQSSHNPSSNPPTNTHTQDVTNTSTSQTHPVTNGVIPPPLPPPPQQQPTSAVVIPPSPIDQPQLISTNAPAPPPHKQHQQQHESTPASAQSSSKKPSTEQFKPMTNEAATNIKIQMERKQAEIKAKMDKEEAEYKAKMEKEKAEYKAKMQALQQEQENCEKAMIKTVIDEQLTMWDADEKNFNSLKVQEDKYDYIKQRHIYYYKFQLALLNGGDGKKEKQALDELYNYLKTTAFKKDEYDAKQNQKGIETSDKSEQEKQKAKRKRGDERPSSPSKHHRSNNTSRPKSSTKTSAQSHATNSTQSPTNSNDSTDSAGATKPVNRQLSKEMTSPSKHKHHHSDTETHEDMKEKQKSYKHSPTAAQHIMEIEAQLATGVSGKELPVRSKFHKNDNIFKIDIRMDPNQSIDDNIQANLQRLTKEKVLLQGPRPALLVPRLQFRLFRDNYGHPLEEIKSFDDFVYNGDVDNTTAVYLLSHDITTTDNQHESATLFIYPTPSPASTSASKKPQFQFAYINITDEKREKMKISSIHSHVQKIFKINCKITYKQHDGQPVNANTKESVTRIINSKKQNRPSSTPESSPQPPSKKIKTDGDGDSDDLGDNDNDDEDDANDDDEDRRFNIRLPHNILKIFNENVEQLNNTNTKNSNYSKENVVGYMFGKVIEEVSDDDEEEKKKCVIAISHLQIGQSIHSSIITTTQQDNLVYVGNICTSHPPRRPFVISQCDNQVKKPYFFTFTLQKDEEKLVYSTFSASNEIMQQYKGGLHGTHKDFQLTEYFKNDKEFGVKFIDNIDIVLFSSQGTVTNSTSSTTTANRLVMQR